VAELAPLQRGDAASCSSCPKAIQQPLRRTLGKRGDDAELDQEPAALEGRFGLRRRGREPARPVHTTSQRDGVKPMADGPARDLRERCSRITHRAKGSARDRDARCERWLRARLEASTARYTDPNSTSG